MFLLGGLGGFGVLGLGSGSLALPLSPSPCSAPTSARRRSAAAYRALV